MRINNFIYIFIGIFIGAIGSFLIVSLINSNVNKNFGLNNNLVNQNKISSNSDILDAHFIEQMIPHHEDAITMSRLALTKAKKEEVKKLAENIIASQSKEIDIMLTWYKSWFGRELPTGNEVMSEHGMMGRGSMHMGMMGNDADLESLENSEQFDREFIEDMIVHHQMAVMMASMLKNSTQRNEMKTLADNIIVTQTEEINQMREWLRNW